VLKSEEILQKGGFVDSWLAEDEILLLGVNLGWSD